MEKITMAEKLLFGEGAAKGAPTEPESIDWSAGVQTRPDGSFIVIKNGFPYHIPADGEDFAAEFAEASAFAAANPAKAAPEPGLERKAPTMEELRARKLREIQRAFERARANGHIVSALGFAINANERATRDIAGLIMTMTASGQEQTYFCDYANSMQPVTLENVRTMYLEVIGYGQELYAKKWALRAAVLAAATPEELEALHWGNAI